LGELPGVANVNVTTDTVTCQIPEGVTSEQVAEKIEGLGFGATLKKE